MVNLGPSRVPRVSVRYPHLMPEDTIIWRRFVKQGQFLPDEVWYDVRVGTPIEVASGQPEWMRKWAEYSSRKRIDIVGRMGSDWLVIEAKPKAGVVALGQVVFYGWKFELEYKPTGRVIPAIVTDSVDPDLRPLFDVAGIVVFEVGRGNEGSGAQD